MAAPISGNYIIRSALGESLVLLPKGNSKAKKAKISAGSFSESVNQCYWKVQGVKINNVWYHKFYNFNTGTGAGYLSISGSDAVQLNYSNATGGLYIRDSGHTMIVNGAAVSTCLISPYNNQSLYLTTPNNGGDLTFSSAASDPSSQEFYFEPTTFYNAKLATPSKLATSDSKTYIVHSGTTTFKPKWTTSSQSRIYEIRYRSRCYDMAGLLVPIYVYNEVTPDGTENPSEEGWYIYDNNGYVLSEDVSVVNGTTYYERSEDLNDDGWTVWTDWTAIEATPILNDKKKFSGQSQTKEYTITTPDGVNNQLYSRAEVQVQLRLTSAGKMADYNRTGNVTHGPTVTQIISQYCTPSLTITAAIYTPDGLALTYSTNYTIAGSSVTIDSIKNSSGDILIENYKFTGQESTGDLYLNSEELYSIPQRNSTLTIIATITEENGLVSGSGTFSLTCSYDASFGMEINPEYILTDRMTWLGIIEAYDVVQCFLEIQQLDGQTRWVECERITDFYDEQSHKTYAVFEIVPPYNVVPKLMWVCVNTLGEWTSAIVSPSDLVLSSDIYSWYWITDEGIPSSAFLKYQIDEIMKPEDKITLSANEFITTAREYPVFRYSKTLKRSLDLDGIILNSEEDPYALKPSFEAMAVAGHCIYRQPDGKWYQVGIKSISFSKEKDYIKVQIQQEAETR